MCENLVDSEWVVIYESEQNIKNQIELLTILHNNNVDIHKYIKSLNEQKPSMKLNEQFLLEDIIELVEKNPLSGFSNFINPQQCLVDEVKQESETSKENNYKNNNINSISCDDYLTDYIGDEDIEEFEISVEKFTEQQKIDSITKKFFETNDDCIINLIYHLSAKSENFKDCLLEHINTVKYNSCEYKIDYPNFDSAMQKLEKIEFL